MDIESWKSKRLAHGLNEKQESELEHLIIEAESQTFDIFVDINNSQKISIDLTANYDFVFENICKWMIDAKSGSKTEKVLKSFYESLIRCFSYCKNIETSNAQAHVMMIRTRNELEALKFESDKESNRNKELERQLEATIKSKNAELYYLKKN